ncbi:hypothetical protein AXF42_Ash019070 [Apostasia shenzhenica]|uniref:Uncharacterized protein n=1 Tax=Apostasia shenzhenica TaxID=1088818 RepID=A0A2I0BB88_9ASPA|nr:hypothetical protein AXF42_Ash019069 [Apostasia shenzhenica]PKA65058.1 hypothetical protein AXF42_Ash019070 [Apostasia shenzhenica]
MASSRFLLLLLLGLLVFAATAAAEVKLPINYISVVNFNNEERLARVANYGYQAYKDARNSSRGSDLPPLINERWIDVGVQLDPIFIIARRLCVIFEGNISPRQVPPEQFQLKAIVRVKFLEQFGLSLKFRGINQHSIIVDKIEYHIA